MKYVVVTGASTGIGLAGAEELVRHGYHVFGSVRKTTDATRVKDALGENFTPLLFDVTDHDAVRAAADQVTQIVGDTGLAGLVNNAGIGIGGPLMELTIDELRFQFEVNFFGALAVTQAFLPLLGARRPCPHPPGRIINISSVGGKVVAPFLVPYAASKHALEALSHGLRRELLLYGIDVVIIAPGAVKTPIWDKADEIDRTRFEKSDYWPALNRFMKGFTGSGRRDGLPAEELGILIRQALENDRPRTRYSIVPNRIRNWLVPRYFPDRWLDRFFERQLFS